MKLSKKIRNPLLSIETILENSMSVANNNQSEQVVLSRQDACRMLQWIEHLKNNELEEMALIEKCLIGQ